MIHISVNELKFLRELFVELKHDVDHSEINEAITMLDGLIEEGRKLTDARLQQILEQHKELMASRSIENNEQATQS